MKKFIIGFVLGIIVMVAAVWYLGDKASHGDQTANQPGGTAAQAREIVENKLYSLKLSASNIQEELARTGQVVREKAQDASKAVADATADARITASIKSKLVASPDLSALSISVNTTARRVTLSGTASSADNIGKAIQLAMDTDGVNEVISTIQVKP